MALTRSCKKSLLRIFKKDLFISYVWVVYCCYLQTHQKRSSNPHYRWLWGTMWLLGIELRTSGGVVSALNCWALHYAFLCLSLWKGHHAHQETDSVFLAMYLNIEWKLVSLFCSPGWLGINNADTGEGSSTWNTSWWKSTAHSVQPCGHESWTWV